MARTRGGGVISGVSARSRRSVAARSSAPGERQQPQQSDLSSQPPSGERHVQASAGSFIGSNTAVGPFPSGRRTLNYLAEGTDQRLAQKGGSQVLGGSSFSTAMSAGVDGDDALDDILGLFEDAIGDEQVPRDAPVDMEEHASSPRSASSIAHRNFQTRAAVRKSPLSSPKNPVWRMLYIDPDVSDPKLVAGLLEKAASRALRCGCVFDVATDIVEALADVRGDTMWVYRGVFINESLYRHQKLDQCKRQDTSIKGKHLSQFLRQAGMSEPRIVLLVSGDVRFDTADAGAHGLSAVLRKPFTKDGFCDILRGMFFNDEPQAAAPPPVTSPPPTKRTSSASHPRTTREAHPSPSLPDQHRRCTKASQLPEGSPLMAPAAGRKRGSSSPAAPPAVPRTGLGLVAAPTAAAAAATAAAAAAAATAANTAATVAAAAAAAAASRPVAMPSCGPRIHAPSAYPACLGFTPFPPSMMNGYLVSGFLRPGQAGPRRKYTKIAPREEDDIAPLPDRKPSGPIPSSTSTAVAVNARTAVGRAGQGPSLWPVAGGALLQ